MFAIPAYVLAGYANAGIFTIKIIQVFKVINQHIPLLFERG